MKLAAALMLVGLPAFAQDLVFSPDPIAECFQSGGAAADCIGTAAQACIDETPGGYSTAGMSGCFWAENEYWDGRLNATYQKVRAQAKEMDVENGVGTLTSLSQADALRDMQRAWIPYRDAKCDYVRSQWGGGTGGGPASAACMMRTTAEQALFLETMLVR